MPADAAVDLEHLDKYTGGNFALNREILQLFDNQCQEMLAKLENIAGGDRDPKSWREITHSLKGAARGVGAFALADAAAQAEKVGSDRLAAIEAIQEMKARSQAVQLFIEDLINPKA
jgi:HPt (histidine-containing phosphotransfer) domain-containing protein